MTPNEFGNATTTTTAHILMLDLAEEVSGNGVKTDVVDIVIGG